MMVCLVCFYTWRLHNQGKRFKAKTQDAKTQDAKTQDAKTQDAKTQDAKAQRDLITQNQTYSLPPQATTNKSTAR
jgi:hypothetical protein